MEVENHRKFDDFDVETHEYLRIHSVSRNLVENLYIPWRMPITKFERL